MKKQGYWAMDSGQAAVTMAYYGAKMEAFDDHATAHGITGDITARALV